MARKSREVRLHQAQAKLDEYKVAGLDFLKEVSFLGDMVYCLERKKGLSPRRREWLDALIDSPIPTAKNHELWDRIVHAGNAIGLDTHTRELLLKDFAIKAFKGWAMSEKQVTFLNNLLEKAEDVLQNGPYRPDVKTVGRLRLAHKFAEGRRAGYWANRPGEYKAFTCIDYWFKSESLVPSDRTTGDMEEWHVNKLLHSSRVGLREIDSPTFKAGDIVSYRSSPGLVVDGPRPGPRAEAHYALLIGGEMVDASVKLLKKRFKKTC